MAPVLPGGMQHSAARGRLPQVFVQALWGRLSNGTNLGLAPGARPGRVALMTWQEVSFNRFTNMLITGW